MATLAAWSAATSAPPAHTFDEDAASAPFARRPNVYVLVLDGYPRADTLSETFGIDNSTFLDRLRSLGFAISESARANYNKTWLTLASTLNGAYVEDLLPDDVPEDPQTQLRWLHQLINRAQLLDIFRENGYEVVSIPPAFTSTALESGDRYLDGGQVTEFEGKLIRSSPWTVALSGIVRDWLLAQQRDRVEWSIQTLVATAHTSGRPQVVFAHIHSPHTPFVLHSPNDSPPPPPPCFPVTCDTWDSTIEELDLSVDEYGRGLKAQLQGLNGMLVDALGEIVAADPDAVIILMSDHGLRYSLADTSEHFRAFLAARTPDGTMLFARNESIVNVFRTLLAVHFGQPISPLPYRAWLSHWGVTLDLTPVR